MELDIKENRLFQAVDSADRYFCGPLCRNEYLSWKEEESSARKEGRT